MIQKVGFKNFRRFKNFPEMDLGDINIFVGRNNAGKSTVLKALQLMKGNLNTLSSVSNRKNIFASMKPMFVFDVDELAELRIDNFERALYNKAERKEITLSATIDGCSFTIVLDGQNIEQDNYYVAVPYNFIELKDDAIHLTFDFQTRDLLLELKKNDSERFKDMLMSKKMMLDVYKRQNEQLVASLRRLNSFFHSSSEQLDIPEDMIQVVENPEGTANDMKVPGVTIAGKTGTAELKNSSTDTESGTLGWFDCFTVDYSANNSNVDDMLIIGMVENTQNNSSGGSHYVIKKIRSLFVK